MRETGGNLMKNKMEMKKIENLNWKKKNKIENLTLKC